MTEDIDLYREVGYDVRVWNDAGGVHKMGWLRKGDVVHLYKRYGQDWYRINPDNSDAPYLLQPHNVDGEVAPPNEADYREYWVQDQPDGLFMPVGQDSDEPDVEPEEPSTTPTDAEIGRVVRFLFGL